MQKKSNVLDKPVSHHKSSTSAAPGGGGGGHGAGSDIDVKKLTVSYNFYDSRVGEVTMIQRFSVPMWPYETLFFYECICWRGVRRKKDFYLQFFMHIKFKVAHLVKLANIFLAIFSTKVQK